MSLARMKVLVHGTGSIGMRHAHILKTMEDVEVTLLPVHEAKIPVLNAEGFKAIDCAEAESLSPELVVVATETQRHVADALHWLGQGAWTLVEKPLSVDLESIEPLSNFPKLRVACCMRAHDALRQFKKLIPEIGALHSIRIEAQSYLPDWRPTRDYRSSYSADSAQGGVLRDLVHELDFACWIFGKPAGVQAWLNKDSTLGIDAESSADLTWELAGGGRISIRLDYVTRPARRSVVACGEGGTLMIDLRAGTWRLERADGRVENSPGRTGFDVMYEQQLQAVLGLVKGELDPIPLPGYREARDVMALIDAARRSSALGGSLEQMENA